MMASRYPPKEPDPAPEDRLDLQAHLLEVHGYATTGTLEELKARHEWIRKFADVRTQG